MIFLSFDQDWAPDWACDAILDQLESAGLRATLFVTHDSPFLERARASDALELAIHPNYLPGSSHGATEAEVTEHVMSLVPEAVGVRAHGLVRSTALLERFGRLGLIYESSDLMDGLPGLAPLPTWNGVVRIPIFWEDDVHLRYGRRCEFETLGLDADGLKVLNFHPILIALNCSDTASYESAKAYLRERGRGLDSLTSDEAALFRETESAGLSDLFDAVIGHLARTAAASTTLAALAEDVRG